MGRIRGTLASAADTAAVDVLVEGLRVSSPDGLSVSPTGKMLDVEVPLRLGETRIAVVSRTPALRLATDSRSLGIQWLNPEVALADRGACPGLQ
jgi:hypothetical protein